MDKHILITGGWIYFKGILIYSVVISPTILLLPMYITAVWYAITFGFIACISFIFLFYSIWHFGLRITGMYRILFSLVPLSVLPAFQAIEWMGSETDIWHSGPYLLFPLAAVISGWISLYTTRKKIFRQYLKNINA